MHKNGQNLGIGSYMKALNLSTSSLICEKYQHLEPCHIVLEFGRDNIPQCIETRSNNGVISALCKLDWYLVGST